MSINCEEERFREECPKCCYAVSGTDPMRIAAKLDAHIEREHPEYYAPRRASEHLLG